MFTTMSSSVAPSSMAVMASETFTKVVCPPWGKPTVVPTATPVPSRISFASATAYGLMQTLATPYSAARRQPASRSALARVGPSSEWSIRLAIDS